jgi:PKD repeat protein
MKRIKYIAVCFLIFTSGLFSQNETAKWYFGAQAGLDFMGAPGILTNGVQNPWEGCSSIANSAGSLLFYSDGITIWNQTHAVMANGTGLFGNSSTTQSGVIVKRPGSSTLYYIFTADAQGGANGLRYSIVDMALAGGNGSVTVKNVLLFSPTTEKITAVRHCNGVDVWVVTHDYNSANFRSYLLTATGVGAAVVTSLGPAHTGNTGNTIGQMKASPNGRKLCLCMQYAPFDCFHLCDFDNNTGVVSNLINLGNTYVWPYGIEFSPDGRLLYGGKYGGGVYSITQWNVCAGTSSAIIGSAFTVSTSLPAMPFSFQLAKNGKIYVCRYQQQINGVISSPNTAGAGCNYIDLGQSNAPRINNLGLPNFVTSYLKPPPTPYTYTTNPAIVTCLTASFFAPPGPTVNCSSSNYSITGYNWNFGDPPSGSSNTSIAQNPTHAYPGPGNYTVSLIVNFTCGADTIISNVTVNPCGVLPVELTSFRANCNGSNVDISWETSSEKNNSLFMLKRSSDGLNYKTIAEVKGHGQARQMHYYAVTDKEIQSDVGYHYMLSQVDDDKTEKALYQGAYVRCESQPEQADIFPVPTSREIFITCDKDLHNVSIEVMNGLGQTVKSINPGFIQRNTDFIFDTSDLPNGSYYVLITTPEATLRKKIIVNK